MGESGFGVVTTAAQRGEVRRLRAEGLSIRRIAAEVFGDARFRGRVERILAAAPSGEPLGSDDPWAGVDVGELSVPVLVRMLLEAWFERYRRSGRTPTPSQLNAALRTWRQLEAIETVERLNAAHRARDS